MQCPVCVETQLVLADRQGIEIDYCPRCRGVWLDRGELDKLIERTANLPGVAAADDRSYDRPREGYRGDDGRRDDYRRDEGHYPRKKKRGGFLDEIFDFD